MCDWREARGAEAFRGATTRRGLVGGIGGALAFGSSARADQSARDRNEGLLEDGLEELPLRALSPRGGGFRVRTVVALGADGVRTAVAPGFVRVTLDDRIDLSGTRLGRIFRPAPFHTFVTPDRRVGALRRQGSTLIVDLRDAPLAPADIRGLLRRPVTLLTKPSGDNRPVSATFPLPFGPAGPADPRFDGGEQVGSAYVARGALLLSPPYGELFGGGLF